MQKSIFTISICFLILLFLSSIESRHIYAQTEIPAGDVSGTWTEANSPYHINGEITIPNDSTLIIEPGVEVIFTGHYKFNVQGRLLAIGTENDTILFTINDTTGFHNPAIPDGGWHGIKLIDIPTSNDSTIFKYCIFQYGKENSSNGGANTGNGGAIYSEIDKLRISHCLFQNNLCFSMEPFSGSGGAIFIGGGKPIIEYCEFYRNQAFVHGSALSIAGISSTAPLIRNNHFHHNNSSATIAIYRFTSPIFINNLIEYNQTEPSNPCNSEILLVSYAGNAKIINNTIVNNTCSQGAVSIHEGSALFINNIIYGNEPKQVHFENPSSVDFYNCLIEGGKEGFTGAAFTGAYENCLDADPIFVSSNDFHLQDNSNCIGTGYYDAGLIPPYDFDGNLRPNPSGSMPDIGAYENPLAIPAPTEIPAGDVSGTWTKAYSPYIINGEITIPNDSTLTIEPGVEVVFTGHYKFNVQGRLLAIGTENDTILFTINDTTGFHNQTISNGGWHGIRFIDIPSNNDSSKIVYCKLEYGKANTGAGYYDRWGGAICAKTNKLLVSHCMFRNNTCYHPDLNNNGGGAIAVVGDPIIEFCEFTENRSSWGSAMLVWGSNLYPLIRNNYFHHNLGHGTINIGSWSGSNTSPILINNIIADNISNGNGSITSGHGIIHISTGGGLPVLINNTFVNNSSTVSGGAIFVNNNVSPLLINNIIYGNEPSQVYLLSSSSLGFHNCLIEGGRKGFTGVAFTGAYENCIDADPLFVSSNDYHLQNTSPCIGAGIDSIQIGSEWYYSPSNCYYGGIRPNPVGSMPDIGACENELGAAVTAINGETNQLPTKFVLEQNYPNPFNPTTKIKYTIPNVILSGAKNLVTLKVYDVLGNEIATLVNEYKPAGSYEVEFYASELPSGVYFYQLKAGSFVDTKKMILLK